jgi:hypothetical protein
MVKYNRELTFTRKKQCNIVKTNEREKKIERFTNRKEREGGFSMVGSPNQQPLPLPLPALPLHLVIHHLSLNPKIIKRKKNRNY